MDIINSFEIENEKFYFHDISNVLNSSKKLKNLPIVLKILLESNLRKSKDTIEFNKIVNIFTNRMNSKINFYPSRIIMKDFTGIPALIDLASMRDIKKESSIEVDKINPQIMLDLIMDNSLNLDKNTNQIDINKEYENNYEKYEFIKWAEKSFSNLRVVPPGSGICHPVNLEYLSTILHVEQNDDKFFLYPETILGTDSHTTMINSLGVLAWGVEGIKAQTAMLGLPLSLELPEVVGVNIHGVLKTGIMSTDLVLRLTEILKKHNVENKLVEFYGEGLKYLTLEDRSIISNMAPEYGAICSFFAIDEKTISYFNKTRDNENYGKLIKAYLEKQDLFYTNRELDYDELVEFDLSILEPNIFGPKNMQERVDLNSLKNLIVINNGRKLKDTDIVDARITLCTSNSNPYLLIHSALVAKKALEFGLTINKNIKVSLDPGSLVVKEYLEKLDLLQYLEALGFHIIGYGCSTSSLDLDLDIETDIKNNNLNVSSISSEKLNIQDSFSSLVKSNYLMSPSLVIIYALVGTMKFDLFDDVVGLIDDKDIYMKDLWPTESEVGDYLQKLDSALYKEIYKDIFKGNEFWRKLIVEKAKNYNWNKNSTCIQSSQIFDEVYLEKIEIKDAGILLLLEDFVTSEEISASGQISLYSPSAKYLESKGIKSFDYGSYENRRTNSEVMLRGTFDNVKLQNLMVSKEGGYTMDYDENEIVTVFEKSEKFKKNNKPLVIFAGVEYGKGVSLNWASKGTFLLGVKAVIARSFDETHKSDLIAFGVLPLEFIDDNIQSLKLKGYESITILADEIKADSKIIIIIHKRDIDVQVEVKCRLDSQEEVDYYKNGGTLSYLLKGIK